MEGPQAKPQLSATFLGLIALLFWAASAVVVAELRNVPTFQLSSIVFLLAFFFSAIIITVRKRWKNVAKQAPIVWIVGTLAIVVNQACYVYAIKYCPPEQAEVIYYLWPLMVLLISSSFFEKRKMLIPIFAGFVGLVGVYLLITKGHGIHHVQFDFCIGYVFALFSAFAWVVYSLFNRYYSDIPLEMNGLWCGLAFFVAITIHFFTEETKMPTAHEMGCLLFIGFAVMTLSLSMWSRGMQRGHVTILGVMSYFTPLISIFMLIATGKTQYSESMLISCQLVIAASLLIWYSEWRQQRRRQEDFQEID